MWGRTKGGKGARVGQVKAKDPIWGREELRGSRVQGGSHRTWIGLGEVGARVWMGGYFG
jgi:hypothetical protein